MWEEWKEERGTGWDGGGEAPVQSGAMEGRTQVVEWGRLGREKMILKLVY